jgi:hypothetical protein
MLSKTHEKTLLLGGLTAEVIEARGYETIEDKGRLKELGFVKVQRRAPGLLIPHYDPAGVRSGYQFRPNDPRLDEKEKPVKYENPSGSRTKLDVPPGARADLQNAAVPLWVTEGSKKADAAVAAGLCCVSLQGVSAYDVPEWDSIPLTGRSVYVCFDNDLMTKATVQVALEGLTAFLRARGARVQWIILPEEYDVTDSSPIKVGLDDWLVQHGGEAHRLLELAQTARPNIRTNDIAVEKQTEQALAALKDWNVPERLFNQGGTMVEVQGTRVEPVSKDRAFVFLSKAADWHRLRVSAKGEMKRTHVSPPKDVRDSVLASDAEAWGFNPLERVVSTPVFSENGKLRTEAGYSAAARSYYSPPEGLVIPPVSAVPTADEVEQAKSAIEELLYDFAFVDQGDEAAAWALLLQPFARELIRGQTPLFSVQAPKQGTGKTVLAQTLLAPAMGEVHVSTEPHGDDEMRKRLTSVITAGRGLFFLDNVTRYVNWPSLAGALTIGVWEDRVLGSSRMVKAPVKNTFVMTANNPTFSDDLKRRVVPIRLDAYTADPALRGGFRLSLPADALNARGRLIWAACTLVGSWVAAGRPVGDAAAPRLASYGPWARVMGGILTHIGVAGFLTNLAESRAEQSPEAESFVQVARYAVKAFGEGNWWLARELADGLYGADIELNMGRPYKSEDELFNLLKTGYLSARKNQMVGPFRLEREAKQKSAKGFRWRFVRA